MKRPRGDLKRKNGLVGIILVKIFLMLIRREHMEETLKKKMEKEKCNELQWRIHFIINWMILEQLLRGHCLN